MIEDRLRAAFTALAETADTPPPGLRSPSRRAPLFAAAAAVLVIAGGVWVASQPTSPSPPATPPLGTPTVSSTARPVVIPYRLYTHCGVDEAKVGSTFYEAVTPLPGPPQDWGNPYQDGTMTLVSKSEVVFRDALGHAVQFRSRPGATEFKVICQ